MSVITLHAAVLGDYTRPINATIDETLRHVSCTSTTVSIGMSTVYLSSAYILELLKSERSIDHPIQGPPQINWVSSNLASFVPNGDNAFLQPISSRSGPSNSEGTLSGSISLSFEGTTNVVDHMATAPPSADPSSKAFSTESYPSSV
ncbi:hypothetical protein U1Q18_016926 [Sarracenia purpurea var. burkii]